MPDKINDPRSREFARIFRLLTAAKDGAQTLQLKKLAYFADMALLQLVMDWEGLEAKDHSVSSIDRLLKEKAKIAMGEQTDNVRLFISR